MKSQTSAFINKFGVILPNDLNSGRGQIHAFDIDEHEYYWYSSARDYAEQKGLLKVEILQ